MNRILLLLFALVSLSVSAQDTTAVVQLPVLKFGYLSYDSAIHAVPGYALVQQSMNDLRSQYEAEQKRAEQDFNLKYEEFLEGQRDFPETILRKRQTELKELLERNVAFKAESRRELQKAEAEAMAPLKARLAEVLAAIGHQYGYAFILNTDVNAVPFIHSEMGEDVSGRVVELLENKE